MSGLRHRSRFEIANGLHWVRGEIDGSLMRARSAIEQHLEGDGGSQHLPAALAELRMVRGALSMIECFGASVLAQEMLLLLQVLIENRATHMDEAYAALSGATLQLSDYVDLLAHGAEDRALILQPVINELRLARAEPLLTEADLFAQQLRGRMAIESAADDAGAGNAAAAQALAQRELAAFQSSFLQWFRGQNADAAMERMGRIADLIAVNAAAPPLRQLWAAYAAFAECLRGAVPDSLDLKRLFGRAGSQIKLLAENGEAGAVAQLGDAAQQVLFQVARSPHPGPRASALVAAQKLDSLLLPAADLDELRRRLRGPNTTILNRVYEEIRRDFAQLKDDIDLAVRTGGRTASDQGATRERLRRLAQTVGALGLPAAQAALLNQAVVITELQAADAGWFDVATAILRVEHSLEEALFRVLGRIGTDAAREYAQIEAEVPHSQDLRESVAALLRECLTGFAQLKRGVDIFLKNGETAAMLEAPKTLHEIGAALKLLGIERASEILAQLERYAASGRLTQLMLPAGEFERFADAVACAEVYLEALRDGLPSPERILDDLAAYNERLGEPTAEAAIDIVETINLENRHERAIAVTFDAFEAPSASTSVNDFATPDVARPEEPASAAQSLDVPAHEVSTAPEFADAPAEFEFAPSLQIEPIQDSAPFVSSGSPPLVEPSAPSPIVPAPVSAPVGEGIDPEIRDIFIEEAGEVLGELERQLPELRREPANRDVLNDIRRAFHTLKGSGRMAGAMRIGEFGWAIEQMLNRCLDGTLAVRAPVFEVLDQSALLLPELIENFRSGGIENPNVALLIARSTRIIQGNSVSEPDLLAVFREDARDRLGFVRRWLEAQDPTAHYFPVEAEVLRAFHTLRGSASVVQAQAVSGLAAEIENYLNSLRARGQSLTPPALAMLADVLMTLPAWIETSGPVEAHASDLADWSTRIEALLTVPAGESKAPAVDDRFCIDALDALQTLETRTRDWAQQPEHSMALDLRAGFADLASLAEQVHCSSLATLSQAIAGRLVEWSEGTIPGAGFFSTLLDLFEGLYQQLDAYREGGQSETSDYWLSRARTLARPAAPKTSNIDDELLNIFSGEAEELLAELDRQQTIWIEGDPTAVPELKRGLHTLKGSARTAGAFALGDVAAYLEQEIGHLDYAALAPTQWRLAAGLVGLHRLLGNLQRGEPLDSAGVLAAIGVAQSTQPDTSTVSEQKITGQPTSEPTTPEPPTLEWAAPEPSPESAASEPSLIQTHESASDRPQKPPLDPVSETSSDDQLSGAEYLAERSVKQPEPEADTTQLIERAESPADAEHRTAAEGHIDAGFDYAPSPVEPAETLGPIDSAPEPAVFAPLATHDVDSPSRDASPLLEELQSPSTSESGFNEFFEPTPAADFEVADSSPLPTRIPETEFVTPDAASKSNVTMSPVLDFELTDIFSAEAGELLETLDSSLDAWQNGDTGEPVLDIQRALHTLKGGARMARLDAMGEAAHEMESQVNAVLASGEFPDVMTFNRLRDGLDLLLRMHDQIRRGEAELLVAPSAQPVSLPDAPAPPLAAMGWSPELFWRPEQELSGLAAARRETARVSVESLDAMLNQTGEISIYRSRLEERSAGLRTQLQEMTQTITRIRDQLRMMDIETEAQIAARGLAPGSFGSERAPDRYGQDFDPLEMDRFSRMQELSRALAESISDLVSLQTTMDEAVSETDTLLLQQSRINTEVQQGLMGTLMVPFSRQVQRLIRVVRQTAQDNGKQADLQFSGAEAELDRNVLERITAPLEHLLRNAVVHGIEDPAQRAFAGKPLVGLIQVTLHREGGQLLVDVSDDGAGLDLAAIRAKAVDSGRLAPDAYLADSDIASFIFEPGFSTARELTQDAGRGIGMDVVASEVKQLGGTLELRSEPGQGARFLLRLPLTLAVSQALLVGAANETFAIPLPSVEGIARIPSANLADHYRDDGPLYAYGGRGYRVRHLSDFLELPHGDISEVRTVTAILVRLGEGLGGGERRIALVVDRLIGNRDVVAKAVGPQVSSVPGVAGATLLADGRVVLILDVPALVAEHSRRALRLDAAGADSGTPEAEAAPTLETIMVVDDSITMRRVAERLLVRNGYRVVTARDGLDAIAQLQTESPVTVLLDIEMPRADGFEVAAFIRNNERLRTVPIIMITSRSGEKHRERARVLGVDRYLIKPYQEEQLLSEVRSVRASS